jgi:uncharacterized metal-binding protein
MPTASERAAILAQVVAARGLVCAEPTPTEVAANCDGADASDLVIILDTCPLYLAKLFNDPSLRYSVLLTIVSLWPEQLGKCRRS